MASYPHWHPSSGSPSAHAPVHAPPPPPPPPSAQTMVLPPELQALNITPQQVAALLGHLQAGTLPFPPPPPPPPHAYTAPFMPLPPQMPAQNGVATPVDRAAPRMDLDREEGEVSDAPQDQDSISPASRKRKLRVPPAKSPLGPAAENTRAAHVSVAPLLKKKEAVLPFVAALHQEGFTFAEFVREGFDESLLRHVYQELRIPVQVQEQVKPTAVKVENSPVPLSTNFPAPKPTEAAKPAEVAKPAEAAKPAVPAKPAAPMSRQDYLARLQAAKTKKNNAAAPPSQPVKPATTAAPPPTSDVPAETKPPNVKDASAPVVSVPNKQSQTTELVRKKMEALKATQRRLANNASAAPSISQSTPTPTPTTTPQASKPPSAQPTDCTIDDSVSLAQGGRASSLIPGLYMSVPAKSPQPETQNQPQPTLLKPASAPFVPAAHTLALNSTTSQLSNGTSFTTSSVSRKRPVASDLNEAHSTTDDTRPYKRPFGQSRQNSSDDVMIIEVSEDEDTSDDDDENSASTNRMAKADKSSTTSRERNIRDLPPLRDFPQRPTFNKQQGVFTPPLGTPGISTETEELRRKEREINDLNFKIKEFEKRKAVLKTKAQLPQSQPQTPSEGAPMFGKSTMLQTPAFALSNSQSPAAPPSFAKKPDAKPLSDRRAKIQADLSARQIQSNTQKARILELQKEMADLQKKLEEDEANQQKLRDELESLDVNTEGMTQAQMEAKKQEMDELFESERTVLRKTAGAMDSQANSSSTASTASNEYQFSQSQAGHSFVDTQAQVSVSENQDDSDEPMSEGDSDTSPEAEHDTESQARVPEHVQPSPSDSESDSDEGSSMSESTNSEADKNVILSSKPPQPKEDHPSVDTSDDSESAEMDEGSSMSESTESEIEKAEEELVWIHLRNLPFASNKAELRPLFKPFNVKIIYAPRKGSRGAGYAYIRLPQSQAMEAIGEVNGKIFGGRKMTVQVARNDPPPVKFSPEPSPEPPREPTPIPSDEESTSDDEMDISSGSSSEESDEEGNVASSASNPLENKQPPAASSSSRSSEEPSSGDEDEGEDKEEEEEDEDRMDLESPTASSGVPSPAAISNPPVISPQPNITNEQKVADDLAPELQPDIEQQKWASRVADDTPLASNAAFTPYESVLKKFKNYRFHPDFPQEVQGGYNSLTYSHKIDAHKELCRYEVASGVCNDHSCEYQHFRDMAVPDDTVVVQMATDFAKPDRPKEEVDRFNSGLSIVLQQLQADGNTSTEEVAARVALYRREFFRDPTNILGL